MAVVTYKICDRCKKKIDRKSGKLAIVTTSYEIRWIIKGCVHEHDKELCGDCSDELEKFMSNELYIPEVKA